MKKRNRDYVNFAKVIQPNNMLNWFESRNVGLWSLVLCIYLENTLAVGWFQVFLKGFVIFKA